MTDADSKIIQGCRLMGVDRARLEMALKSSDDWGRLVFSYEYLTVLENVLVAMKREEAEHADANDQG